MLTVTKASNTIAAGRSCGLRIVIEPVPLLKGSLLACRPAVQLKEVMEPMTLDEGPVAESVGVAIVK